MRTPSPETGRCDSLVEFRLREFPEAQFYMRCATGAGHLGKHKTKLKKWSDEEEAGGIDTSPPIYENKEA